MANDNLLVPFFYFYNFIVLGDVEEQLMNLKDVINQ